VASNCALCHTFEHDVYVERGVGVPCAQDPATGVDAVGRMRGCSACHVCSMIVDSCLVVMEYWIQAPLVHVSGMRFVVCISEVEADSDTQLDTGYGKIISNMSCKLRLSIRGRDTNR